MGAEIETSEIVMDAESTTAEIMVATMTTA